MSEALTIADYEEVMEDHRRLVREIDVTLNGACAAKQASLCDVVGRGHAMPELKQWPAPPPADTSPPWG